MNTLQKTRKIIESFLVHIKGYTREEAEISPFDNINSELIHEIYNIIEDN